MKSEPPILQFENVRYTYPGHTEPALDNMSLALPAGKRIVVLGHNGAGKSSLFLHCNGILAPQSGTVRFQGRPLKYARSDLRELRKHVGIVFQSADEQLFSASVQQDISFGPLNLGLSESAARQRVQEAAEQCEISHLLDRPTHALSGGEKARAALAGVLAMDPEVLLVDEPTASLDPLMRRKLFAIFEKLTARGKTIVLATHELELAHYWADYIVIMHRGRVLGEGASETILSDQNMLSLISLDRPWYSDMRKVRNRADFVQEAAPVQGHCPHHSQKEEPYVSYHIPAGT